MAGLVEVFVGVVGRVHGIRGDVFINVRTDEPGCRFQLGSGFRLASGGKLILECIRWHRGRLAVSLRGYPDRTAVETLRGGRPFVDASVDETLSGPEEYFDRRLIGLRVLDVEGRRIGEVAEVLHLSAQDCLAVETSPGGRLAPFASALATRVDPVAGEVQSADVGGLLEEFE